MKTYVVSNHFAMKEVMDYTILVPVGSQVLKGNVMISLNETAKFLYQCLTERQTVAELAQRLSSVYDVTEEDAVKDTERFIETMVQNGAVSENEENV